MKLIVVCIGIITLYILFIMAIQQNNKTNKTSIQDIAAIHPLSCQQLIQGTPWSDIEEEMIRLSLDNKREMSQMHLVYEKLLKLEPATLEKQYELHLYLNEDRSFIDVCSKEEGDLYTEYMIDHEDWQHILAYTISGKSLSKYEKSTIVSAILYSMTANGISVEVISQNTQAHTG